MVDVAGDEERGLGFQPYVIGLIVVVCWMNALWLLLR